MNDHTGFETVFEFLLLGSVTSTPSAYYYYPIMSNYDIASRLLTKLEAEDPPLPETTISSPGQVQTGAFLSAEPDSVFDTRVEPNTVTGGCKCMGKMIVSHRCRVGRMTTFLSIRMVR